ncbi:MAG: hypothetical protein JSV16_07965, partial [Candidatus Hydrogenedentota bacterium]
MSTRKKSETIDPAMTGWKITGLGATVVIVLSIPLYIIKSEHLRGPDEGVTARPEAVFVGSDTC